MDEKTLYNMEYEEISGEIKEILENCNLQDLRLIFNILNENGFK